MKLVYLQKLLRYSLERGVSFEKIIQMPLEEKGKAEIVNCNASCVSC